MQLRQDDLLTFATSNPSVVNKGKTLSFIEGTEQGRT